MTVRFAQLKLSGPCCPDCQKDAVLGWQPVQSIRAIGERECDVECTCEIVFDDETEISQDDMQKAIDDALG